MERLIFCSISSFNGGTLVASEAKTGTRTRTAIIDEYTRILFIALTPFRTGFPKDLKWPLGSFLSSQGSIQKYNNLSHPSYQVFPKARFQGQLDDLKMHFFLLLNSYKFG
jgi:hypothetical protein